MGQRMGMGLAMGKSLVGMGMEMRMGKSLQVLGWEWDNPSREWDQEDPCGCSQESQAGKSWQIQDPIPAPWDSWALILIPLFHRLPPTMATNLSVPLAFVCLLHLANEKVRAGGHSHHPSIPWNAAESWFFPGIQQYSSFPILPNVS